MTIGQAMVISASGESKVVVRGTTISVGDRIETAVGGHVHIRFVDGALVSVRPTSRLVVEDYQYDSVKPLQSLVRFRLEKGVTRAISGAAAENARERFRLNTPLVAIGVRGTDFVVSTDLARTVAAVNQGAIVMAPFDAGCLAQALGPCGSPAAKLLTADMGNTLVEFKNNALAKVEFKPFNGGKSPELTIATPERAQRELALAHDLNGRAYGGFGGDALTSEFVSGAVQIGSSIRVVAPREPSGPSAGAGVPAIIPPVVAQLPVVTELPVVAPPPVSLPPPAVLPLPPAQLAWGRWSDQALNGAEFIQPRLQAREGRSITVGDDNFLLYRAEDTTTFAPGLNILNFALGESYAQFNSATRPVLPASVTGGSFSINFAEKLFQTSLNLTSASTGNVLLQATGSVRNDGIFATRSDTQAVAGAVAIDGKSAGYLFEKAAAGGTLSGVTLWSR
ncbi:MAG: FecR domain-containing protein [Candidatus Saccharibacteria bacterium]|nr:FecR domain-containing protein [Rhodoferax sp.]